MKQTVINPADWAAPKGYSNGVLVEGGSLLFVAGQVGWDRDCRIVSDDFAKQFAQALDNVLHIVESAGGQATSIDKREYVAGLKEIGIAYRALMGRHYPAMTLVEVSALLEDSAKVEIEAMAVV